MSTWYKLGVHLLSDHHPYAFHDHVIGRLPADTFSSVKSIVDTGVMLATLPEMQGIPHTIKHVLQLLVGNTSLPRQPGQIDVRLTYDYALSLIESTPQQPALYAEYQARLGIWFNYIATIPLRLQCHRLTLERPMDTQQWPPATLPQPAPDTRTTADLRQQSTATQPDNGLQRQAVPPD